jgi:beta-galactosidase
MKTQSAPRRAYLVLCIVGCLKIRLMTFPDKFLWGVSSCGFQFEMGDPSRTGLDGNTDWYVWVHEKRNIQKKVVSGDFPEDGPNYWTLYREDHEIASGLDLNCNRIGIEWSRVFPKSTRDVEVDVERADDGRIARIAANASTMERLDGLADVNAVKHYREIVSDLRQRDMRPIVCLNHFTLPVWIHDPIAVENSRLRRGPRGWYDEETVVEFWKFAAYVARKLGDLVDSWVTFNEPMVVAEGYLFPERGFPPGVRDFGAFRKVLCNMVVAHARAFEGIKEWDSIKADPDSASPAEVGLIQNIVPMRPYSPKKDAVVSGFASHIHNLCYLEAITNGWLDENLNGVKDEEETKKYLANRVDWIGVNYYSRNVIKGGSAILARLFAGLPYMPEIVKGYGNDCEPNSLSADNKPTSDFGWETYPEGLVDALKLVSKYAKPMYVTENGIADSQDKLRPQFITTHLRELDRSINEEKLDVRGYLHWAMIDNYEWAQGFRMKFGLYAVDPRTKARMPRQSAAVYKRIIETKEVV